MDWSLENIAMNKSSTIRIIQITDLHTFANEEDKLLNISTNYTFYKVLEKVKEDLKKTKADLMLVTGDLSQDFSQKSYLRMKEILHNIEQEFKIPVAVTAGNHDDKKLLNNILTHFIKKDFSFKNWRVLVLNTEWPGHVAGTLPDDELIFLKAALTSSPEKSVLIFLHHQVLPTNSAWMNKIGLINSQAFLDILAEHTNVKAIVSGHVHQQNLENQGNLVFYTTPSTCWQFARNTAKFKLDSLMPGYRWFELYDDGSYQTEVVRVSFDPACIPDLESTGY